MAGAAPRCGARSKRTGKPCRGAAMPNGGCKLHGGKSTGSSGIEVTAIHSHMLTEQPRLIFMHFWGP
jgi:hypothetical protein